MGDAKQLLLFDILDSHAVLAAIAENPGDHMAQVTYYHDHCSIPNAFMYRI